MQQNEFHLSIMGSATLNATSLKHIWHEKLDKTHCVYLLNTKVEKKISKRVFIVQVKALAAHLKR